MDNYGDFCGFEFNGVHSSTLGFIRVSDGNRYTENLLPAFQDKTVSIPGGDGTYFFDSFYTNKTFSINIAFDSMTEIQMRKMRQVFSTKEMGALIFDEAPYKAYTVKVQGVPQLKYICFDGANGRVYKGEGTIQFIAYNPYARSTKKYLYLYIDNDYPNKNEWKEASGMKESPTVDSLDGAGASINVYNAGDIPADFKAYYSFSGSSSLALSGIALNSGTLGQLNFSAPITKVGNDSYIVINSKTNLIEGCDSDYKTTGNLYNKYVLSGDFFKIPVSTTSSSIFTFTSTSASCAKIEYDYLYY